MKKIHVIIFIIFMAGFSIFLPEFIEYAHKHVEDYETVAITPKQKVKFKSVNKIGKIYAQDKEDWTYFSFEKGKTVEIKDSSTLEWDIAFRRTNFKSNGGSSNKKGKAGLINLGKVDINAVTKAPDNGYKEDAVFFGNISNEALSKWYKYSTQFHTVTTNEDVYIIKTAKGKYAKMQILYYYCEGGDGGCVTIEYFYQTDGSKNLRNLNEVVNETTN